MKNLGKFLALSTLSGVIYLIYRSHKINKSIDAIEKFIYDTIKEENKNLENKFVNKNKS